MPELPTGPHQPVETNDFNPITPSPVASLRAAGVGGVPRFTIERLHAKGGLGQVSVAHDTHLHRDVALKEIRPDRRGETARRRFLVEAEITGQLEHPGIVPIYALESDEAGEPYYAMRFIQGRTLAEAIQAYHQQPTALAFRDLLQRFISVCQTIAFAHSRGIIHRDLKPANVMLGDYGETLVVDWGLAKRMVSGKIEDSFSREAQPSAAAAELPETQPSPSDGTKMGEALGTPAYMAPEQARGEWGIVGPTADIFSLGAILYELLTAQRPFQGQSAVEVLEKARAADFIPPRRVKPAITKALEAVCIKAMAYSPEHRYASAKELAADVEHWLADEPVTAYAEPWTIRAGRWMRHHRTLVTSTAAVLAVGFVGLSVSLAVVDGLNRSLQETNGELTASLGREQNERQRALDREHDAVESEQDTTAASKFLQKILGAARPEGQGGGLGVNVTVRDAVDAAVPSIPLEFAGRPRAEARARDAMGQTYQYLGRFPAAIREFERAHELHRAAQGPNHRETLASMGGLAMAYHSNRQYDKSLPLLEETLAKQKEKLGLDDRDTLATLNNLAIAYFYAGRRDKAVPLYEEALAGVKAKHGPDDPAVFTIMGSLAVAYMAGGNVGKAIPLFEETIARQKAVMGEDHPDRLQNMQNLATAFFKMGQVDRSVPLFEQLAPLRRKKLGETHPLALGTVADLAVNYRDAGRRDDAARVACEFMAGYDKAPADVRWPLIWRAPELAMILDDAGQLDKGEAIDREIIAQFRKQVGAEDPRTLGQLAQLGLNLLRQRKWTEAESVLRECLSLRQRTQPDAWTTFNTQSMLGEALVGQNKYAEAEPLLLAGYEGIDQRKASLPLQLRIRLTEAAERLANCYDACGKKADADKWRKVVEETKAAAKRP